MRRFYHALGSFPLLSIPLYIMLGVLADRARMLPELVVWLQMMFGRLRGGMAYINSVAAMLFAGHQRDRGVRHREPRPHPDPADDARGLSARVQRGADRGDIDHRARSSRRASG